MKRLWSTVHNFAVVAGMILVLGLPTGLQASLEVGDRVRLGDLPGGPGGMFQVDDLNDEPEWNFRTFCVEPLEQVNFTATYLVQGISLVASPSNQPLTSLAAWLYNSFLDGTLSQFNADDPTDVNTLQFGIWKAMNYSKETITEATKNETWYADFDALLSGKGWENAFAADLNWSGTGDVYIVNLQTLGANGEPGEDVQDQLVRLPSPVPEPMSLAIWSSFALATALAVRFHRRSAIRQA